MLITAIMLLRIRKQTSYFHCPQQINNENCFSKFETKIFLSDHEVKKITSYHLYKIKHNESYTSLREYKIVIRYVDMKDATRKAMSNSTSVIEFVYPCLEMGVFVTICDPSHNVVNEK